MIARRRRALRGGVQWCLSYGSRRHAANAHTCRSKKKQKQPGGESLDSRPANDAEDACRVGESRSYYSSAIRRGRTENPDSGHTSFQIAVEMQNAPPASGAGGALVSLPRLDLQCAPRERVLQVQPLHQLSFLNPSRVRSWTSPRRAECPRSPRSLQRRPACTSSRRPGRSPAVACVRVGNGGVLSSKRNEIRESEFP